MSPHPDSPAVPEAPGFVEQRLFLRRKVETPLPIELLPGKEVWLHDLGEGGLSVSGSSRVEPGTATFLDFRFPDPNSVIEAAGVVAWCDNFGRVGVRFTRIKPDSTAALKRWLKSDQASTAEEEANPAAPISPLSTLVSRAHFEISDLRAELASESLSTEASLKKIVERMAYHTRATGAAIAWREGNEVICRASTGSAPEVGVRLNIESGLSGECYRTGNIVALADSEHDSRVDAEVCRQLDFRSLLIVPVVSGEDAVVGIAEVFSSVPGNFEGGDVLLLSSIAELIGGLYEKTQLTLSSAGREKPISGEQTRATDSGPVSMKQQTSVPEMQVTPAPFVPTGFELTDQKSEENGFRETSESQGVTERIFGEGQTKSDSGSTNSKAPRILLGALLVAGGIGVCDYLNWHFMRPGSAAVQSRVSHDSQQIAIASTPETQPAEESSRQVATTERTSAPALPATPVIGNSVPNQGATRKAVVSDQSVESHFSTGLAARRQAEPVPNAPSLVGSEQSSFRVNTTYFLPTQAPQVKFLKASLPASQVTAGRLLHRVNPVFPAFARAAGIRGSVVIAATIGKDGRLKNMKLISGNGALAVEAFRAARQWVYAPYRLDGQPIEVDARIVMDFGRQ